MTIEEQLREFARQADREQPPITAAEIVEHADHGFGPFTTHSSVNGHEVRDHVPLHFTDRDANVFALDAPSATDERSEGSKRVVMARLLAVAAATIVVVGVAAIAFTVGSRTANDPDRVPQAPAPTVAPATTVAPRVVTYTGIPDVRITYMLPDGWTEEDGDGFMVSAGPATVNFWDVENVYADGCEWTLLNPPLGPTVDDLANVWATLPGFTATTPVDITVDGYAGKRVDYTVPDYPTVDDPVPGEDNADCEGGSFALWTETLGVRPTFWAQAPRQQNRQWIIDVDGTRLVINEWSEPGTTPEQLAAMDQFLASIQIG